MMIDRNERSADVNYEQVQVECYSGYKADERPTALTYQGRHREIAGILDRWYEGSLDANRPKIDYFKVRTAEGEVFLLRYLSLSAVWSVRV
jgi:hypothetical protein